MATNIQDIKISIEEGGSLKMIAQAYAEIATAKLKRIRADVERNRTFFNELAAIYRIIRLVAAQKNYREPAKNGRKISLLLTSNYHFYGNVNNRLIDYFLVNTARYPTDRLVIGKAAIEYLESMQYFHPYEKVSFEKDIPSSSELKEIANKVHPYTQVLVYYSQFQSVLIQNPTMVDITQTEAANRISKIPFKQDQLMKQSLTNDIKYILKDKNANININDFILEPEITSMLDFFSGQITILLLEQAFLESELARTASRLISMDEAQNNAKEYIEKQKRSLSLIQRSTYNTKLLEIVLSSTAIKQAEEKK